MPNPSQPSLPDYYDVLGVDFNATSEEVRRAYFQKARQVHPDKDSNSSVDDWHILNKAYTTLTDSIQRQDYNEQLASSDTEGVPDLTRPTLPSTERLSEEFKSCFEHWTHLHNPIGTGSFNKAFIADLKEGVVSPQGESPPKGGVATLPTTFSGVACCGSCPRSLRDLRVGL